jgi:excinuclease ABC subunit A
LRNLGNTLIVVEHDEEIMKAADEIIDIGPMAGSHGGELMFQGDWKKIEKESSSLTANYLMGISKIELPEKRRKWNDFILIKRRKRK